VDEKPSVDDNLATAIASPDLCSSVLKRFLTLAPHLPAAKHNARSAAQARAWRLALLLTGAEDLATEVAIQVRRAQPKLEALDPRRLDRLIVLRSREVVQRASRHASGASTSAAPDAAAEAPPDARALLQALAAIEEQPREAWILARIDGLDEIEVARSMDCSKTAAARFLTEADAATVGGGDGSASSLGNLGDRIEAVRRWLDSLSPQEAIEARLIRHRRRRVWLGVWLLAAAALITAVVLLLAWL
jgi:DNA-directed RNA polymerase specialized sigma24 family protein